LRAVIDAHLVDESLEVLTPDPVASDVECAAVSDEATAEGGLTDFTAIDIKPRGASVIGEGYVAPRVDGQRRGSSNVAKVGFRCEQARWSTAVRGVQTVG
jgi:hypothetical protein